MRILLVFLSMYSCCVLMGQSVLFESHPKFLHFKYNTAWSHHTALLFNVNKRITIGPSLLFENDMTRELYVFLSGSFPGPINFDPIHTTYRVRNGRVLYFTERFNRGISGQLRDGLTVERDYYQGFSAGVLLGFSYIKTKRWDAYVRIIPHYIRSRYKVNLIIPNVSVRMNEEEDYTTVDFRQERIFFYHDFDIRCSTGILFAILPKLSLGMDAYFDDLGADWVPRLSFSVLYSFKDKTK